MCVYICLYICLYICKSIFIYKNRHFLESEINIRKKTEQGGGRWSGCDDKRGAVLGTACGKMCGEEKIQTWTRIETEKILPENYFPPHVLDK